MAKTPILVISIAAAALAGKFASNKKAVEFMAGKADHTLISKQEEFDALDPALRIKLAKSVATDKQATWDDDTLLAEAFKLLCDYEPPVVKTKVVAKGVKVLIRELFAVPGARHTPDEICELTKGTKVSVMTALSDLRSPKYCGQGGVLVLTRLADGKYALLTPEEIEAEKGAKEKAEAEAKAKKAAEKEAKLKEAAEKKAADKKAADEKKAAKKAADKKAEEEKKAAEQAAAGEAAK